MVAHQDLADPRDHGTATTSMAGTPPRRSPRRWLRQCIRDVRALTKTLSSLTSPAPFNAQMKGTLLVSAARLFDMSKVAVNQTNRPAPIDIPEARLITLQDSR
jgi:hypothetical protein